MKGTSECAEDVEEDEIGETLKKFERLRSWEVDGGGAREQGRYLGKGQRESTGRFNLAELNRQK